MKTRLAITYRITLCLISLLVLSGFAVDKPKPETSHFAFVSEYIREVAAIENIVNPEVTQPDTKDSTFPHCIQRATRMQLELGSDIHILKTMNLKPPFDPLISNIIDFYTHKIEVEQGLSDICTMLVGGPKPEIEYGKLMADYSKLLAKLDFIDHALLEATPLVFGVLVDQEPDPKNPTIFAHPNRLIITKAERDALLSDLTNAFGNKLKQDNSDFTVGVARVLQGFLLRNYEYSK